MPACNPHRATSQVVAQQPARQQQLAGTLDSKAQIGDPQEESEADQVEDQEGTEGRQGL